MHHTATSNSYTKDQAAAAVRSIYAYDTNSLGWSDIAYNVLVDKYGQIFEGRAGGLDKAVRSGATGGFNAESWSVSALGNYVDSDAVHRARVLDLLDPRLEARHRPPRPRRARQSLTAANGSGTTSKYADGTKVDLQRDLRAPRRRFDGLPRHQALRPAARRSARRWPSLMGAQLYNPSASPLVVPKGETTPVRVKAYAMTAQSWRLEVKKQGSSAVIRSYRGDRRRRTGWSTRAGTWRTTRARRSPAGVYTVTLQSWNDKTVAVPYAVNVGLFSDPDVYERPADGIFHLEGRGYGHGHGMSQFGAEGAARQGLTPAQILAFYYPGTTVATASPTANDAGLAGGRGPRHGCAVRTCGSGRPPGCR